MALAVVQTDIILTGYAASGATSWGPGSSFTVGSGADRALLFQVSAVTQPSGSSSIDAPTLTGTFNGQPVSFFGYRYHSGDKIWSCYGYLPNPASGAGTLSITSSVGQFSLNAVCTELIGAHQSTLPVALAGGTATSGTSFTNSGTTTVDGSLLVSTIAASRRSGNPTADFSVTSGITLGIGHSAGAFDGRTSYFACAYKAMPMAGADSIQYSLPETGPRSCWQSVEVFAAPAGGGGQTITIDAETSAGSGQTVNLLAHRIITVDAATSAGVGQTVNILTGASFPLSITALPFDGFVFDCARSATAQITLRGQGTTGDSVQVRGASAAKNTAWQSATVDGAGNWQVTFALAAADWDQWYTPEARIGTDDGTKITSANQFGGGHVVGIMGQSQPEQGINPSSTYSTGYTFPPQIEQNLTMMTQLTSGGAWTYRKVTAYTLGQVNVGMAAMANVIALGRPGVKLMIVDLCQSGTSIFHLASDAESSRLWSDFQNPIDLIRSGGSDIGVAMLCWQADDAGIAKTYALNTAPIFIGQRWGGGAFTVGTVSPDQSSGLTVDHILWDCEAPSDQYGRGIFTRDRTKLMILEYPPFNDASTTTDEINFTSFGGRAAQLDRPARDQLRAMHADPRFPTVAECYGPGMHIADFGADVHPARDGAFWGMPHWGVQFAGPILQWMGYQIHDPTIIGYEAGPAGAYADAIVNLPPGASLNTIRTLRSMAAPAVEPPHYQPVMGFEIRRSGQTDAQRRPVMKLSETSYPATHRGTVTIQDAGSGTWPTRRARIRITPEVAFATGDGIEFGRGQAMSVLLEPRDTNAQTWLDTPLAVDATLYDPAALYRYHGMPVRPQPAYATLTVAAGVTITIDAASSAGVGETVDLLAQRRVTIDAATSAGIGASVDLLAQRRIVIDAASSAGVGQTVDLRMVKTITIDASTSAGVGQTVNLLAHRQIVADAAVSAGVGQTVFIIAGGGGISSRRHATVEQSANGGIILQG